MNEEIIMQIKKFEDSLRKFQEILLRDINEDEIILDATIQRFEFTFENAWKSIKLLLKIKGIQCFSPRDAIKKAYQNGWIKDEEKFLELLESRNLTSHTYNSDIALNVYETIKINRKCFEILLKALKDNIE